MISEFIVGRYSQSNAARAYGSVGFRRAKYIGYLGILTSTIILGFYAVVAGWCLQYLFASISGKLIGDTNYIIEYFKTFSSDPIQPCLWGVGFVLITHYVVAKGVNDGIERASKLLMPLLLILLIILVVASCLLPGASKGIDFLLKPDFTKVSSDVFLEALGQAFFSLSLGTACLCTYASYFKKDSNILKSATQIALLDSFIAILAGLMIFPAAFSVGVQPDSGPSLIFITLPNVFRQAFETMPIVGFIISILFYALLVFAALTSTISMHEIGTAFFHEELHLPRNKAAWILTTVCGLIAVFCSLSVGAYSQLQLFGMSLMDFCDFLTAQFMLPAGAFLTSILVGWFVEKQLIANEFTNNGTLKDTFLKAYIFSVKFIVPLCILLIFLHQFHII
jgi:NSS family neurotransmitter:Na+ symporter